MKTRKLMLYTSITAILGLVVQLFLHEFGHMIFAIFTGNKVEGFSIGISSYTGTYIINEKAIPIISLGAFIVPIVFYVVISFTKSIFLNLLNMYIGVITAIQLGINSIYLLSVNNTLYINTTYDLGTFVNSTNYDPIVIAIISLLLALIFLIIVMYRGLITLIESI